MDAAFDNPFDDHRLYQCASQRRVSMDQSLTEPEFEKAVSDGLPQLVAVAKRLSGNDEIASEAVQNALLKASKSWRKFQGRSHVQTWLTRIVIHCVRDGISADRRRSRRSLRSWGADGGDEGCNAIDPGTGPAQRVLDQELRGAIHGAVRELPDRQREVFCLVVWQAMSAREVAQILETSAQNVHANLHAARQRLQTLLQHYIRDGQEEQR